MAEDPDPRPATTGTPGDQDPSGVRPPAAPPAPRGETTPPGAGPPDAPTAETGAPTAEAGASPGAVTPTAPPSLDWAGSTMEIPLVIAALAAANGTDPLEEARKHAAAQGRPAAQRPAPTEERIPAADRPEAERVDHRESAASLSEHGAQLDDEEPAVVTGTHRAAGGRVRRLVRDYAWVIVAIVVAALVALCSIPFTTGLAPSWRAGAAVTPGSSSGSGPAVAPMAAAGAALGGGRSGSPSPAVTSGAQSADPSPAPSRTSEGPAGRLRPSAPARTTASAPKDAGATVALGPASDGDLEASIRLYCWQEFGASGARLRTAAGAAAENWECRGPGFTRLVDPTAMCAWRYGAGTFAAVADRRDAYSWRCLRAHSA